jgi:hypothetical protein
VPGHAAGVLCRIETKVFPQIGRRPIGEIEPPELLAAVRKIEARCPRSGAPCPSGLRQVFLHGIATGTTGSSTRSPRQTIPCAFLGTGSRCAAVAPNAEQLNRRDSHGGVVPSVAPGRRELIFRNFIVHPLDMLYCGRIGAILSDEITTGHSGTASV